jgi:undecaprenyl diphosphate synthase
MFAQADTAPRPSPDQSVRSRGPIESSSLPQHVAIIMDGNGRWAQRRHLPRLIGHRAGVRNLHRIVRACVDIGIPYLTVYAFSTENWQRPTEEVDGLMQIFADASKRETRNLHRNGVRIRHIGSLDGVPDAQRRAIEHAVDLTKDNTKLNLNVAFNYGGRAEVVAAVKNLVGSGVAPADITEEAISIRLYTAGTPDPDLVIRTAGELRLSNFLIWQTSYSEYFFSEHMWPDFGAEEFRVAIDAYAERGRRFGRL